MSAKVIHLHLWQQLPEALHVSVLHYFYFFFSDPDKAYESRTSVLSYFILNPLSCHPASPTQYLALLNDLQSIYEL